jgi:hypothetical protein
MPVRLLHSKERTVGQDSQKQTARRTPRTHIPNETDRTGQTELDRQNWTGTTRLQGKKCQDRAATTGPKGKNSHSRTDKRAQLEKASQIKTQPEQKYRNATAKTGQAEIDRQNKIL